jgi:Short C-terminal domain
MKKIFALLLLLPMAAVSQNNAARFENDTLYSTGGYMIYKGQTLNLAKGTSAAGYFKHLKFHSSMSRTDTYTMQHSTVLVNRLRNFKVQGDRYTIRINGMATLSDGRKTEVDMIMDVENAMAGTDGLAAELTVPAEYVSRRTIPAATPKPGKQPEENNDRQEAAPADLRKLLVADEIKKLFDLFKAGALTKEEFESQKKKLLARQ